jgi:hypothetical protein
MTPFNAVEASNLARFFVSTAGYGVSVIGVDEADVVPFRAGGASKFRPTGTVVMDKAAVVTHGPAVVTGDKLDAV